MDKPSISKWLPHPLLYSQGFCTEKAISNSSEDVSHLNQGHQAENCRDDGTLLNANSMLSTDFLGGLISNRCCNLCKQGFPNKKLKEWNKYS